MSAPAHSVRLATTADGPAVAAIYNHYVATTTISFETDPVGDEEMADRIARVLAEGFPWLVVVDDGEVIGFAYAGPFSSRCAYRFSVESTVYLAPHAAGRGLGAVLYGDLLERLRAQGLHSVIGVIALPNPASVALHEKCGMTKVAHLPQMGRKFDRWIDVGYWQITFAE